MGAYLMYKIIIKKPAKKFIDKLPINEKKRLVAAIEGLPDNGDIKRLQGYDGYYRLRVGSYRIIFYVDNNYVRNKVLVEANY